MNDNVSSICIGGNYLFMPLTQYWFIECMLGKENKMDTREYTWVFGSFLPNLNLVECVTQHITIGRQWNAVQTV